MTRLGEAIRCYRSQHQISVRTCAKQIGLNYGTLYRLERTGGGVTADTFIQVSAWLLGEAPTAPGPSGAMTSGVRR